MTGRVIVVGSLNRDYVCRVDQIPLPGETVLGGDLTLGLGGKGGNQAAAAAAFGGPFGVSCSMVGCVGRDEDGDALVAGLAEFGVDVSGVAALDGVRTGAALITVSAAGENAIVVAAGANERLGVQDVTAALGGVGPGDVVVTQAETPVDVVVATLRHAALLGARPVFNLALYRAMPDDVLALCDPLVVNDSEASGLIGREVQGPAEAADAASALVAKAVSIVVTVGADGAIVASEAGVSHVAAEAASVVDSTGAGDALTGALAAALSLGHSLEVAARWGVAAGTAAVAKAGAQSAYPRGDESRAIIAGIGL